MGLVVWFLYGGEVTGGGIGCLVPNLGGEVTGGRIGCLVAIQGGGFIG